jgi:phytoene/squalene synthetase
MNVISMVFLGVVGLLGAYCFLFVESEHRATSKAREFTHALQVERFDRDFDNAWNGGKLTDPERAQRLHTLEQQDARQQARAVQDIQASKAREQALRRTLDHLSGFPDTKGHPQ